MDAIEQAAELLDLDAKWLQEFDVTDPFSGLAMTGCLSMKPDHRYGALALLTVDGEEVPQRILATPKLHYPFGKTGEFHFPPIKHIDIYEKLDGTNVLAYRFKDATGAEHVTYKLRLHPVLRNGRWGNFLDMWRELLERHPAIAELPARNDCAISFEMYGARNAHLILYENALDCAVLFGIDAEGRCRPPGDLDLQEVPVPKLYGRLNADDDPVAAFARIREEIEADIRPTDDDKLTGSEGAVWHILTTAGKQVLFKCKPESVEAIHWKGGLNKEGVRATCWNLLETQDELEYAALERLLLEEYQADDIERFKENIDQCLAEVQADLDFRNRVLEAYEATGLKLADDKPAVMRAMSGQFQKAEMKKVFNVLKHSGAQ
jgi:hypothetical protein